eukprot:gene14531-17163_t
MLPFEVQGLYIQGRADADQWTVLFKIQTSLDGLNWVTLPNPGASNGPLWSGPNDRNTPKIIEFNPPLRVRHILINPQYCGVQGSSFQLLDYGY